MENKVTGILEKVEGLIAPATSMIEFSRPSAEAYASSGIRGIIDLHKNTLVTWHPPTLEGVVKCLEGPLGAHLVNIALGGAIQYVGGVLDQSTINRLGRDIKSAGEGGTIGAMAQLLVYPTRFNPAGGLMAPSAGYPARRTGSRVSTTPSVDNPQTLNPNASGSGAYRFQ